MTWQPELDELHQREELIHGMGGAEKIAKHHAQGRLTVRERIEMLLDEGTFHEIGALAGAATYEEGQLTEFRPANFVMGMRRIDGRKVAVGGDDFTVRGGAADASVVGKQIYSEQLANSLQIPMVRLVVRTAERFGIEEIIDPRETRPLLCEWVRDAYALLPKQPGRPAHGTRP